MNYPIYSLIPVNSFSRRHSRNLKVPAEEQPRLCIKMNKTVVAGFSIAFYMQSVPIKEAFFNVSFILYQGLLCRKEGSKDKVIK